LTSGWLGFVSLCALLAAGCGTTQPRVADVSAQSAPWTRVIVQLNVPATQTDEQKLAAIREVREALLRELDAKSYRVARVYDTIPAVALEVSPEARRVLEKSPRVASVVTDAVVDPQ
jgi:hypothetical protein